MAGGSLKAHTNEFVEAWGARREVIENTFRWSPRTVSLVLATGVLVPLLIYKVGVLDFVRLQSSAHQVVYRTSAHASTPGENR